MVKRDNESKIFNESPLVITTGTFNQPKETQSEQMMARSYIQENFNYDIDELNQLQGTQQEPSSGMRFNELKVSDSVSPVVTHRINS